MLSAPRRKTRAEPTRGWRIESTLWAKLSRISAEATIAYLRFATGEAIGPIPGLYRAGVGRLSELFKWPIESIRLYFDELEQNGLLEHDPDNLIVFQPEIMTFNPPRTPDWIGPWASEWATLPDCQLKWGAWEHARGLMAKRNNKGFLKAFDFFCPEPSVPDSPLGNTNASPENNLESKRSNLNKRMAWKKLAGPRDDEEGLVYLEPVDSSLK